MKANDCHYRIDLQFYIYTQFVMKVACTGERYQRFDMLVPGLCTQDRLPTRGGQSVTLPMDMGASTSHIASLCHLSNKLPCLIVAIGIALPGTRTLGQSSHLLQLTRFHTLKLNGKIDRLQSLRSDL